MHVFVFLSVQTMCVCAYVVMHACVCVPASLCYPVCMLVCTFLRVVCGQRVYSVCEACVQCVCDGVCDG